MNLRLTEKTWEEPEKGGAEIALQFEDTFPPWHWGLGVRSRKPAGQSASTTRKQRK